MKVELNIENDAELRAYIKNLIKGQVTAIIRDEIISMASVELNRKLNGGPAFDYLVERTIKDCVLQRVNSFALFDLISKKVDQNITNAISKIDDKLIDQLVKKKINNILDNS